MRKVLIIAPHFPPSNLASVHRSRLFAQHLPQFGWKPIILTVDEKYYEETPDRELESLLPGDLQIEKVNAFGLTKPRLIGDLGLRAFFQLYRKAKTLIVKEKIDFLYIPIPSFYIALLGRWLHGTTGIPYGIDYIDPWVHAFPGSDRLFSRHWFSMKLARILEPIAVKKVSLITGVAPGYYEGVIERNPHLKSSCLFGAMPYGGEELDHEVVRKNEKSAWLFKKEEGITDLVYAGALLPKAFEPLDRIFRALEEHADYFSNLRIHFIGTGKTPNDPNGFTVKEYAQRHGLWERIIFEYPKRIPYLDVLVHLNASDGIFILGSTEPHYTPSKVYQGILSAKPILAVLHEQSTAVRALTESKGGIMLTFNGEKELDQIERTFPGILKHYLRWIILFKPGSINRKSFEPYAARNITGNLAKLFDEVIFGNQ